MRHRVYNTFFFKLSLLIFIGLFVRTYCHGQKDILAKAKINLEQGHYIDALELYNQLPSIKDKNTILDKAICLIETNKLSSADSLINELISEDSSNPKFLYYRAYLFQQQGHFDLALKTYKLSIKHTKSKDPLRIKSRYSVKKCRLEQKISNRAQLAFVENLGPQINSKYNDFGAIQSPNFTNLLYFNSDRQFGQSTSKIYGNRLRQTDMYSVEFSDGMWSPISTLDDNLNTNLNETIFGFPPDGSSLIYLHNDNSIHINHFSGDSLQLSKPVIFNSKIKGQLGDNYVQVYSDSIFIYSSLRKSGIGGYDIFIITLNNGEWNEPFHFGNSINSPFNEICPFLTRDGKQLFFSSDRNESIGGYDIFMSEYNDQENKWSTPQNLGLPINSHNNDLYYRLDQNGNSANFSSDRSGGHGGLDLYVAYLKQENEHNKNTITGIPFLNYSLEKLRTDKLEGQIVEEIVLDESIKTKGPKLFTKKPLFFNVNDRLIYGHQTDYIKQLIDLLIDDQKLTIDIHSHSMDEGDFNFKLYSSVRQTEELLNYLLQNGISENRIIIKGFANRFPLNESFSQSRIDASKLNKRISFFINGENPTNLLIENSDLSSNMLSSVYKNHLIAISELSYSIEIAKTQRLYKNPEIELLPQVKLEKLNEFYHYTTGVFKSYEEALIELKNIQKMNFQKSEIIAYINGKRILENELNERLKNYPDLADFIIDYYSNK